jgi:DNA replication protein DnaD
MRYMSKTLAAWNDEDLRTLEQIEAADAAFRAEREGKKAAETQNGSFNTDDFFAAAVRRSFGDDFDPDKQGT